MATDKRDADQPDIDEPAETVIETPAVTVPSTAPTPRAATVPSTAPHATVPSAALAPRATTAPAETLLSVAPSAPAGGDSYRGLIPIEASHYVLGRELARGGMGRILAAHDRRLDRPVAVKQLLEQVDDLRARFEHEARVTARLQHPAIVPVYEAGKLDGGDPFYAMKLVSGRPLDKVIAETRTLRERLAHLPKLIAVAEAIAYAHAERVIHRDLKPHNILVGAFGETVVIDWGLAKDLADETSSDPPPIAGPFRAGGKSAELTRAGTVMGTPAYMPPEQAVGDPVDDSADVYALGAILYHALAGVPPFTGKTTEEVLANVIANAPVPLVEREPDVPRDLASLVVRAMAREPAKRPTSHVLAEELRRFQTGQLVASHAYSLRELVLRWLRRHRTAVGVAAVALVVVAALSIYGVLAIRSERDVARAQRDDARVQRETAKAERTRAEAMTLAVLEEQGRAELFDGELDRAVLHLASVYRQTPQPSIGLRTMLASAMRVVDGRLGTGVAPIRGGRLLDGKPVTISDDGAIVTWDPATGNALAKVSSPCRPNAAFGPVAFNDTLVATTTQDAVDVCELATGVHRRRIAGMANHLAISPDGAWLAHSEGGGTDLVELATGARTQLPLLPYEGELSWGSFFPDSKRLLLFSGNHFRYAIRDIAGKRYLPFEAMASRIGDDASISPDGALVAVGTSRAATIRDAATGKVRFEYPKDLGIHTASGPWWAVDDSEDLVLWNVATGESIARLFGTGRVDFDRANRLALVVGETGTTIWQLGGREVAWISHGYADATSEDASAVIGVGNSHARLYDGRTERLVHDFGERARTATISDDGSTIVVERWPEAAIELFDARTFALRARWAEQVDYLKPTVSPDGRWVVAWSPKLTFVYDAQAPAGGAVARLDKEPYRSSAMRFSRDGKRLAIASEKVVQVWEVGSWKLAATFEGASADLDATGSHVLVGTDDKLELWDVNSRRRLAIVDGKEVAEVALSPDATRAASNGTVWELATGRPIAAVPKACRSRFVAGGTKLFTSCERTNAALSDIHPETRSPAEIDRLLERLPVMLDGAAIVPRKP